MEPNGHGAPCAYIPDGYERDGYIAEEPRLYPAVKFRYRPMLAQDRSQIQHAFAQAAEHPRKQDELMAKAIESRVVQWDLIKQDGEPVPVKAREMVRLQPNMLYKLYAIVAGNIPSDEAPSPDLCNSDDGELDAALRGESLIEAEAREAKN